MKQVYALLVSVFTLALLLGGCGGGQTDKEQAIETVESFLLAYEENDAQQASALTAPEFGLGFSDTDELQQFLDENQLFFNVTKLEVTDQTENEIVIDYEFTLTERKENEEETESIEQGEFYLEKVDGQWLINNIR